MHSQCMKSDGKSTGLWVSTLALVAKPVSHRMRLDYLPSLAFLDAVMDVKKTACWLCESLAGINPYLVLAAFLPHCASSKPCWVLMPKLILRGCFFCIFYEKSGNKQCFWPQTHFAAGFWRAVWVKSVKCKTLFAKLLEIWDKHFHPANLNHRCPWKIQRLSRAGLSHALFAQETSFCGRSSTGEALHQDVLLEQARNLKMFSVLWKEQGNLYCGTPLFHHESRHPDCWGFQLTVVLSSVSTAVTLSRKVLSKLIPWCDPLVVEQSSPGCKKIIAEFAVFCN